MTCYHYTQFTQVAVLRGKQINTATCNNKIISKNIYLVRYNGEVVEARERLRVNRQWFVACNPYLHGALISAMSDQDIKIRNGKEFAICHEGAAKNKKYLYYDDKKK